MLEAVRALAAIPESTIWGLALVFTRVGAISALLPGFGETSLSIRVRLTVTVAFTAMIWPIVFPSLPVIPSDFNAIWPYFLAEAAIGLSFGLIIRMTLMALQYAGAIAGQATALAQIMGAGATPDPMPAIGNILVISGIALALAAGLHVKVVIAMTTLFDVIPVGTWANPADTSEWGLSRAARVATLAFLLAAPFLIASLAYNVTLGVINRAMPQLMVAFIGAPAITAAGILILLIAGPVILTVWLEEFDSLLESPFQALP